MYVDLGMERSKAGVLESLNVITPLTVREGTRGADFGGVPPLCYGNGHLRQKKVSPATKWDNTMHYIFLPIRCRLSILNITFILATLKEIIKQFLPFSKGLLFATPK
jgi:hypothetical protein